MGQSDSLWEASGALGRTVGDSERSAVAMVPELINWYRSR